MVKAMSKKKIKIEVEVTHEQARKIMDYIDSGKVSALDVPTGSKYDVVSVAVAIVILVASLFYFSDLMFTGEGIYQNLEVYFRPGRYTSMILVMGSVLSVILASFVMAFATYFISEFIFNKMSKTKKGPFDPSDPPNWSSDRPGDSTLDNVKFENIKEEDIPF